MGKVVYFLIYLALGLRAYHKKQKSLMTREAFILAWFLLVVMCCIL